MRKYEFFVNHVFLFCFFFNPFKTNYVFVFRPGERAKDNRLDETLKS